MAALSVQVPYPVFYDRDGHPLDNGNIYIGVANLDPVTNPLQVYYDEALTITAAQPLKTNNGYIYRNGTPAQLYVNSANFSIAVKNANNTLEYSFPDGTGLGVGASGIAFTGFNGQVGTLADLGDADGSDWIGYTPSGAGAIARTAQNKMRDTVDVRDFGAVGDGVTDDTAALQAWLAIGGTLTLSAGNYRITSPLVYTQPPTTDWRFGDPSIAIIGAGSNSTFITYEGASTDTVLRINGVFPVISGFYCQGFTIKRADGAPATVATGVGLWVKDMLTFEVSEMKIFRQGVGLYLEGCLCGTVRNSAFIYNNIGAWAEIGTGTSTPNVLTFDTVNFQACYTRGLKLIGGSGVYVVNCNYDGIGSTDTNGIGIEVVNMGTAGGVGLVLENDYFENIGGVAVYITQGILPGTYIVRDCIFNRFGGTSRKMTGVVFDPATLGAGGAPALLDLSGSAFNAYGGWVYDPTALTVVLGFGIGGYDGLQFVDATTQYQLATEIPTISVLVEHAQTISAATYFDGLAATLTNAYNINSIVRNSVGNYTFTFQRAVSKINGLNFMADNSDCVAKVSSLSTSAINIVTHVGGVATDSSGWLQIVNS